MLSNVCSDSVNTRQGLARCHWVCYRQSETQKWSLLTLENPLWDLKRLQDSPAWIPSAPSQHPLRNGLRGPFPDPPRGFSGADSPNSEPFHLLFLPQQARRGWPAEGTPASPGRQDFPELGGSLGDPQGQVISTATSPSKADLEGVPSPKPGEASVAASPHSVAPWAPT